MAFRNYRTAGYHKSRTAVLASQFPEAPAFLIHQISILTLSQPCLHESIPRVALREFVLRRGTSLGCFRTQMSVQQARLGNVQHMKQGVTRLDHYPDIVIPVPSVRNSTIHYCAASATETLRRRMCLNPIHCPALPSSWTPSVRMAGLPRVHIA